MTNTIAKATINFGKINYTGTGKRYPADVTIELRRQGGKETFRMVNGQKQYTGERTPEYVELSICGEIWNHIHTDIVCGGQCLDTMNKYLCHNTTFAQIYKLWKRYHLNGMHAGTPEQEEAIAEWMAAGNKYDYKAACEYLKSINLYEVPFTGKTCGKVYNGEMYKYGCGWVIEELPGDVLLYIEHLVDTANANREGGRL